LTTRKRFDINKYRQYRRKEIKTGKKNTPLYKVVVQSFIAGLKRLRNGFGAKDCALDEELRALIGQHS